MEGGTDQRLRRDALQIVLQLPSDRGEALRVLCYAEELLCGFLADKGQPVPANPGPCKPAFRLV